MPNWTLTSKKSFLLFLFDEDYCSGAIILNSFLLSGRKEEKIDLTSTLKWNKNQQEFRKSSPNQTEHYWGKHLQIFESNRLSTKEINQYFNAVAAIQTNQNYYFFPIHTH